MIGTDPYTPAETRRFECTSCLERVRTDGRVSVCPECGARMQNVSVPRE